MTFDEGADTPNLPAIMSPAEDDKQLVSEIKTLLETVEHQEKVIGGHQEKLQNASVEIGRKLNAKKATMPRGAWEAWMEANLTFFKKRRAQDFMFVAKRIDAMPDFRTTALSFNQLHKAVKAAWRKFKKKPLSNLIDMEKKAKELLVEASRAIDDIRGHLKTDERYREWIADLEINQETVFAWQHMADLPDKFGSSSERETELYMKNDQSSDDDDDDDSGETGK